MFKIYRIFFFILKHRETGLNCCTEWKRFMTHLCRPVLSKFAVRETASLGIMGAPRVPSLNPSESIVLCYDSITRVCSSMNPIWFLLASNQSENSVHMWRNMFVVTVLFLIMNPKWFPSVSNQTENSKQVFSDLVKLSERFQWSFIREMYF